jgi:hypothetical protein
MRSICLPCINYLDIPQRDSDPSEDEIPAQRIIRLITQDPSRERLLEFMGRKKVVGKGGSEIGSETSEDQ